MDFDEDVNNNDFEDTYSGIDPDEDEVNFK